MSGPRQVGELLLIGERVMGDSSRIFDDHDNRDEAEQLLAMCLDVDVDDLDDSIQLTLRQAERYLSLVARRAAGEPFPFLTGHIEFYGLDLLVEPGAFVPRPSSELLVAEAVKKLRRRRTPVVVDVCTGAGPIALAIADEFPSAEVWGLDIAEEGLRQGRRNARRLEVSVHFKASDMYSALPARLEGSVDVITGHVPYVPVNEVDDLPEEVREYEPLYTLSDESDDGLFLMRAAAEGAARWLKPGGWLLLEMSDDTVPKGKRLCKQVGFVDITVGSDRDGLSEVVEARKPSG